MAKLYIRETEVNSQLAWLYVLLTKSPVEVVKFDSSDEQHVAANPLKLFPFLIEGDMKIWGEHAVVMYIAEKHASNALYGVSVEEKAKINSLLYWLGGTLHRLAIMNHVYPQAPSISNRALISKLDIEGDNKLLIEYGLQATSEQLHTIEKTYFGTCGNKFLCDKQTVADFYLALILLQLENVDMKLDGWPKLCGWFQEYKTQILALMV